MKRVSPLLSAVVVAAAVSSPAFAQTPPVTIPTKDFGPVWTGFYVGAAFGAGGTFNRLDVGGAGLNANAHGGGQSGILGSIYGGVDYQVTQRGVLGLSAEASYAGFNGSVSASVPGAFAQVNQNTGFGWAVLLRAGYLAAPSTLLYLTGGYAGQILNTNGTAAAAGGTASFSTDNTMHGWTLGPGFETMLTHNLSAKLEYRYSPFGRQTIGNTGISMEPSTHTVRAGLSYRFGGLGVVSSDHSFAGSPQPFNWTGVYLGGAIGGGMGFAQTNAFAGPASARFNSGSQGLLGGFFGGADWQFSPQALVGVMADYTFQGITGGINLNTPGGSAYASAEQNRQWSVMGRLGWLPVPSTLLYAAGGYSQLNVRASAGASLGGGTLFTQRDTGFSGFTVGPGIETVVTGGWTTRLEYRFSQFEQKEVMSGVTYQPSNHTIRAGISYKFGFGGRTMTAEAAD